MYTATARLPLGGFAQAPLGVLREHLWLIGLVGLHVVAALLLAWSQGVPGRISLSIYSDNLLISYAACLTVIGLGYLLHLMLVVRPARLFRAIADDLRRFFTLERLLSAVLVLGLVPVFTSAFTSVKALIPVVRPFDWDATFVAWDFWLHGGQHPWEILQSLLGTPLVTHLLNMAYHLWFFVIYGFICWQALSRANPLLRMQFLLSTVLAWGLLGNLAAILFSSAGPCYFGRVTGLPDPFAPLMAYLQGANESYRIWALDVQDLLWRGYQDSVTGQGAGISAMPSMHIGAIVLTLLLAWRIHHLLGWVMAFFTLLIFLGSVHLGWHYAIDGYASLLGALAIWYGVGWLLRRDPYFGRAVPSQAAPTA